MLIEKLIKMSAITDLCFLCARDKRVDIEIDSLSINERNKIGEFSVLNYNLKGKMPTRICQRCHKFMREMEEFQQRCEIVEKMFMEVLKSKSAIDVKAVRAKYKLDEEEDNSDHVEAPTILNLIPLSLSAKKDQELTHYSFELLESVEDMPEVNASPPKPPPPKPKLLNPTILPKIENKVRMDILRCDLCDHRTSTKSAMANHMLLHINNEKLFECSVCQKKFASNRTLKNHSAIHMGIERKVFECKDCSKVLSSKTALNTHIKWHHSEREFKCEICGKDCATKNSLAEHLKSHETAKQHICPICTKEYKTASSLSNHLDIHSNTEYKCGICQLQLKSRRTLKQHEKVHSDVVLHKCEICEAEFKRTKAYKEHLITHTNMRPYKCSFCEKTFTNGPNCRKHMRDIHPKELEQSEKDCHRKVTQLPKIDDLLQMSKRQSQ